MGNVIRSRAGAKTLSAFGAALAAAFLAFASPGAAQSSLTDNPADGAVRVALTFDSPQGRILHSTGSGFVAAPNLVVTAGHVVAPTRQSQELQILIVAPGGAGPVPARIVRFSPLSDLALLRFEGPSPQPLTISAVAPTPGDPVVALGYPDMDDLQSLPAEIVRPTPPSRSSGTVASLRDRAPTGDRIPTINHEAAISSGSSGGPLLDGCGRVIGVNSWHARGNETLTSRSVAIRTGPLLDFLRQSNVSPDVSDDRCVTPLERAESERDAAVAALTRQNNEIRQRLVEADRLTRFTLVAVVAGGGLFLLSLAMMAVALFGLRRTAAAPPPAPAHEPPDPGGELVVLPPPATPPAAIAAAPPLAIDEEPRRPIWRLLVIIAVAASAVGLVIPLAVQVMNSSAAMRRVAGEVNFAGDHVCTFDAAASSVREGADTRFRIDSSGCVNGRTLYAPSADGRSLKRVVLSEGRGALDVLTLSLETGEFRREQYALGPESLSAAIDSARTAPAPDRCEPAARTQVARRNSVLMRFVDGAPAERIVWRCQKRE